MEPGWKLFINGVNRTALVKSFNVEFGLNERAKATAVVSGMPAIPARFEEVISYHKDGITPMFGGVILHRHVVGVSQADDWLDVSLECGDYFTYADWSSIDLVYDTPVTLKTVLTDIVNDVLSDYGITLFAGQVDGPTLESVSWTGKKVADAIRELSDRTGYVARMLPTKALVMFIPGTDAAPVAITDADPHCFELEWQDSDRTPANKIILTAGPSGIEPVNDERHDGDGVTRIFPLHAPFVGIIGALRIDSEGGGHGVGIYGVDDTAWTYDASINSVRQRVDQTVVASGDFFLISYNAQFPFTVTAGGVTVPVIEHRETRPDIRSIPIAQELADALLASLNQSPREPHISTDEDGFDIGQALTIDLDTRGILTSIVCIITSLNMTIVLDTDTGSAHWVYVFDGIESSLHQGSYLDQWRQLLGGSAGSSGAVSGGVGGTISTVLSSPFHLGGSRQFSIHENPAAWKPVPEHVPYVAQASFTGRVRVELWAFNAGVGVTARLRNVTDSTDVESSEVTSQTATPILFIVPIVAGKTYRLEIIADTNDEDAFGIGVLEAAL